MEAFDAIVLPTQKKKPSRINLNCIVLLCYLLSAFTNIVFFFIFILSKYLYKWIGFIFIIIELVLLRLSIVKVIRLREHNFRRFRKVSSMLIWSFVFNCLFFIIVTTVIVFKNSETELIVLFVTSCFTWCAFHILFISILRYYIRHKEFKKPKTFRESL
jgi:hypothetical protein